MNLNERHNSDLFYWSEFRDVRCSVCCHMRWRHKLEEWLETFKMFTNDEILRRIGQKIIKRQQICTMRGKFWGSRGRIRISRSEETYMGLMWRKLQVNLRKKVASSKIVQLFSANAESNDKILKFLRIKGHGNSEKFGTSNQWYRSTKV